MVNVRSAAAELLQRWRQRQGFAPELLDQWLSAQPDFTDADRRLLTQLVCGVIRRRATLDALLLPWVQRPWQAVEPALRDLLRLGCYQLVILTHIPAYAAVHATVEAAAERGLARAKGFLNAILRRLATLVSDAFAQAPAADAIPLDDPLPPNALAEMVLPVRYRCLRQPLLPAPHDDPVGYLATAFSLPRSLVRRWLERYGWEESLRRAAWSNTPPPLWLRVHTRKISRETFRLRLAAAGIEAQPGPHPQSLYLPDPPPVPLIPGYSEGEFTVQDLSAMEVASALEPLPGWRVLDLCAAPGGKTTHLAELMDDRGTIIACDVDARRLDTLQQLVRRLDLHYIEPRLLAADEPPPAGPYDAVLVDVPCSNTGVLHRRPEARWRWHADDLTPLTRRQTELLLRAVSLVRPGGAVLYSTCSLEPEENEQIVHAVRRAVPHLLIEKEHHALPGRPADGGYYARLRRRP
ncbi:MAG: hypothetical protein NZ703_01740 [Gemmataceae bacterium]|nr:hypothetical protein [Gemmataceae bacterium]